jgi:hypothetical protein
MRNVKIGIVYDIISNKYLPDIKKVVKNDHFNLIGLNKPIYFFG